MAEFKFSCPQCGQHIQCDTGYGGAQINCPTCQKAIVVPQAPRSAAAPPAPYAAPPPPIPPSAPPGLSTRQSTAAPAAGQRFTGAPVAPGTRPGKPKSKTLRKVLAVTAAVVGAAIGFFGVQFALKHVGGAVKPKPNPAAQVATPSSTATIGALSILGKVYSAYTNTTSATADGTFTLSLDLSNLTMADLNPNARPNPNASPAARNRRGNIPRTITINSDFSVKRGQSNWYYFAMEPVIKIDRMAISNTSAFWSSDKGTFIFQDTRQMGAPPQRTYMQTADAATASATAEQMKYMRHAFDDPAQLTKIIKDLGQSDDEPVNGEDCYTITAKVLGQKVKVWVNKSTYLISQSQITLGGAISDADIDDAFSLAAAAFTNMPPGQLEMAKPMVKQYTPIMTKIRGTLTSTSKNTQINPTLTADDFSYPVPSGVRLTRMPGAVPANTATPAASREVNQRNVCINNLRQIDGAINEWALEKGKTNGTVVTEADIKPYLKLDASGNLPKCPGGGTYTLGKVGGHPTCTILGHVLP